MDWYTKIVQMLLVVALAPLMAGFINKIKNNLRMKKGPSIFQPYFNLLKLFSKEEVVSVHASWIFLITPYVVLGSVLAALFLVPLNIENFITLIFLMALGRFFLALAGLDPATTFGGMGSSREMFISTFAEPAILMAFFAVFLRTGAVPGIATLIAGAALFLVCLAETSRLPVDNQETHLELTMVHEAMALEYSGRSLALIELAACVKQMIFFLILVYLFLPFSIGIGWLILALLGLGALIAIVEVSIAKMRLFRAVDFLGFASLLAVLAIMAVILGK